MEAIKNFSMVKLLFVMLIALLSGCQQKTPDTSAESAPSVTEQPAAPVDQPLPNNVDKNSLAGERTRTDAPYKLNTSDIGENGVMKAGYFNPKSIHVEKSTWVSDANGLGIYIELQDVNYPGSNYTLTYVSGKDMLAGKYFQAVEGMTYDVAFIRTK